MSPFQYPEVPPLSIGRQVLEGWEALDQYGRMHHPVWMHARRNAEYVRLTELDSLRLLAGELLRQNVELQTLNIKSAFNNPHA